MDASTKQSAFPTKAPSEAKVVRPKAPKKEQKEPVVYKVRAVSKS